MVPPSAIGSEKGTPSSSTSAPPACSASNAGTVADASGKPHVKYATNAACGLRLEKAARREAAIAGRRAAQ
jgi:hypothetical protein